MQLEISGHHVDVTNALRNHVHSKMARIERHFDNVIDAEVVLEVAKDRHFAEVTMKLSGTRLHAEATSTDMYAAITDMVDRLDRQTCRYKEKKRDHHNREATHIEGEAE